MRLQTKVKKLQFQNGEGLWDMHSQTSHEGRDYRRVMVFLRDKTKIQILRNWLRSVSCTEMLIVLRFLMWFYCGYSDGFTILQDLTDKGKTAACIL